MIGMGYLMKA